MMVNSGLECFFRNFPSQLKGRRIGVLCHAPSITKDFRHITDLFLSCSEARLCAVFGPQHGLFGETQDNMIEWTGSIHPEWGIPVFSLYGEHRKPTPEMLSHIDALVIDLQDVGARLYTYAWTMGLCMEACTEAGIPVWVLDRPNPISMIDFDGPVLKREYFTFVGGAEIPMCHRMTLGEIALWLKARDIPGCDLTVVKAEGWRRSMMYNETGLPWVIPSPNLPTLDSAIVYPGMVLFETINVSEGRGSTIPFELFGAPYLKTTELMKNLASRKIEGCAFRVHNFIPTFNKYAGKICNGIQVHVTELKRFKPVEAAFEVIQAIIETSPEGSFSFNQPPYEYEYNHMPFDILSGDDRMRKALETGVSVKAEAERWRNEIREFRNDFFALALYKE